MEILLDFAVKKIATFAMLGTIATATGSPLPVGFIVFRAATPLRRLDLGPCIRTPPPLVEFVLLAPTVRLVRDSLLFVLGENSTIILVLLQCLIALIVLPVCIVKGQGTPTRQDGVSRDTTVMARRQHQRSTKVYREPIPLQEQVPPLYACPVHSMTNTRRAFVRIAQKGITALIVI